MLSHPLTKDMLTCTYKKKPIAVGFYDAKLAERMSIRIARDPKRVNCRLRPGKMHPVAHSFDDEDVDHRLQGLRRDLDARLVIHRDFEPEEDDGFAWQIRRVPDDMFYAYPFTANAGIVICYDIDVMNLLPLLPTRAFDEKNIFLKSVLMMAFDTPSVGQLNRLYKR